MNKENNKKVRIKVRLSEEENEKLKHYAAACGRIYEYNFYNTHTAATEDYLLARTAMGDTYSIPTSDSTRITVPM